MNYMAITIMFLHPRSIALIHLFVVYERRETRLYPPLGEVKNEKREKRQGKGCRKEKGGVKRYSEQASKHTPCPRLQSVQSSCCNVPAGRERESEVDILAPGAGFRGRGD
jgi:hypothetical protein